MQQLGQSSWTTLQTRSSDRAREWAPAAILFGLLMIAGFREGAFWPADAFTVAVASCVILVAALILNQPDRRSALVIVSIALLALWWLLRAGSTGAFEHFLPLGASALGFAAAFAAVRPLRGRAREFAALGMSCLGAVGALIGFAGLIWRWYPMAMPAQGLWRLSSTLTYSDAAGLVLALCLLLALGVDLYPALARVVVCVCAGGLLATQSRGAYVAFAVACPFVPWRRFGRYAVPLLAGVTLGAVAIASSPDAGGVPWLGVVLVLAVVVAAAVPGGQLRSSRLFGSGRMLMWVLLGVLVVGALALLLHHEVGLRALAPSNQDRSVEWSTGFRQWLSAPAVGVGPDRLLFFHAVDGTYARFVHNEYLQILADSGLVGLALLALTALAVMRVARRFDVLSSCATAALVGWAVGGLFDFDWHLAFLGLLAGWCAGLAYREGELGEEATEGGGRRRVDGGIVCGLVPFGRRVPRGPSRGSEHRRGM